LVKARAQEARQLAEAKLAWDYWKAQAAKKGWQPWVNPDAIAMSASSVRRGSK
jgi:hypothetical protein